MSWEWMVAVALVLYALHQVIKAIGRVEIAVSDLRKDEPGEFDEHLVSAERLERNSKPAAPPPEYDPSMVDDGGAGVRELLRRIEAEKRKVIR